MNKPIDLVLLYVNMDDPVWKKMFLSRFPEKELKPVFFRDWGFFKYLFRGIEKNMPYINKIHLVVSNKEQVPDWVNQNKVHIVLHEDIMPKGLLPCFNSVVIEFFLNKIPGLAEHFVYFNDDFYAFNYIDPSLLFDQDKACGIWRRQPITTLFEFVLKRVDNIVFSKYPNFLQLNKNEFIAPPHGPTALLKSSLDEVLKIYDKEIRASLRPLRDAQRDLSPIIYSLHQWVTNKIILRYPKHIYLDGSVSFNYNRLLTEDFQYVCINDDHWTKESAEQIKNILQKIFDTKFPEKSKYEW